jgi:hypothetical protein
MDSDCLGSIFVHFGADMKFALLMLLSIIIGVALWCILGYTLEKYGVSNMWFMVAGYWFYPVFNYINDTIMWHK